MGGAHDSGVERDSGCFVCGWANTASLGVRFENAGGESRTSYLAQPAHEGWPGLLHGGVLFALLDDAAGWAARYAGQPSVTGRAEIRYHRPVATGATLEVSGRIERRRNSGLVVTAVARRAPDAVVVASLTATLIAIPSNGSGGTAWPEDAGIRTGE